MAESIGLRSGSVNPTAAAEPKWFPGPPPAVYTCTLSPELVAKAREELQEKPEWRLRDVQALRDMIQKEQPNLRTRLDDAFLLRFLRARKFDYDRALQLLVNYHAGHKAWPEVFQDLKPSMVKHVLDLGFLTVLPRPDPNGRYILCLRPGKWKPNDYPFVDNVRALYLTLEKLIQPEETQVNGIVILADYTGVGMSQASNPGPFLAKKVVSILQYMLHSSDLRSLHQNIPRSVLPEEYGGTAGQLDMRAWSRLLLDSEEEFIVEFCQPDPLEGVVLPESMLFHGEEASGQDEDAFRGLRSPLYSCY
ncbi:alpha-tocopherol transfer protein-like isoform X2 [Nerophis ophidion]|uniref:alpha-tocopherol transfer protein-like isoform X2 n=1 Tax=Nerophis ophidion TaxID=159077 RepID=UPI002ADFD305|nr:alpha-tocopherol transfer protein-like isoform X2 [Nerophis ophidion]